MIPKRRMIPYVMYVLFGAALFIMGTMEIVDEFWGGVGTSFLLIGVLRLVRIYRFRNDETYREKVEIETKDERNQFIRNKAWAWAGYLFVLIAAVCTLGFQLAGQRVLSTAAGYAVCLIITLYWISYMILKKKY